MKIFITALLGSIAFADVGDQTIANEEVADTATSWLESFS
jgi:hypothetical protein